MKKSSFVILLIIVPILSVIPVKIITEIANEKLESYFKESDRKKLLELINEANKITPRMIDDETRADSVVLENNNVVYRYTIVNFNSHEITYNNLKDALSGKLNEICSDELMLWLANRNMGMRYTYYGKDGLRISYIDIDKRTCGIK